MFVEWKPQMKTSSKKVLSNVGCIKGSGNGQAGIGLKLSNLGLDNWHPSGKCYKTFFDAIMSLSV